MKVSKKILPLCVLGCLFSFDVFAAGPMPSSFAVLPKPASSSMPAGLMRRPTAKSQTAAAAEANKRRVTSADVVRAWEAPGSRGIVSAEYFHPYGTVREFSDPYTGAVQGYELRTPEGSNWPYDPVRDEINPLGRRSLENKNDILEVSREAERSKGGSLEQKNYRGRTSELTLLNGSRLMYNSGTGEVLGSKEYSFSPNGSRIESTLYVDTSSGRPVVLEYKREFTVAGSEIDQATDLSTGNINAHVINGK